MYLIDKKLSLYDACAQYLAGVALAAIADDSEQAASANDRLFAGSEGEESTNA